MSVLILASPKLVKSSSLEEWLKVTAGNAVLFLSDGDPVLKKTLEEADPSPFCHVEYFPNMPSNDFVEKRALELHRKFRFRRIVALSEADIIRAAQLRARLEIAGQSVDSALIFRNKVLMKRRAAAHGFAVAPFLPVNNTLELLDFVEAVGYPIVVKPISGRGSSDTYAIRNEIELNGHLSRGIFGQGNGASTLLAEKFIQGDIYHIDGLMLGGRLRVLSVARYVNTCLEFVNGASLGSYTLEDGNPLKAKLEDFGEKLMSEAFPTPTDSPFHIEVFVREDGEFCLCEVACRIGGNGINNEVKMTYGVDIIMEYIRSQCQISAPEPIERKKRQVGITGRLLIPPVPGVLKSAPEVCPFPWVQRYDFSGELGKEYERMKMSNSEIANFLLRAENEEQMHERIQKLLSWFRDAAVWEERRTA